MEQKFEVFMDKNNDVLQSFSLRKIPTVKHSDIEIEDKNNYDKVKILELSKQFDKDNYSMRVSGHFDSENEYEEMKLNFILRKLSIQ